MSFGRLERTAPARPMSDINMTPLIDVMLVLLVIFIVAAPLMTSRLPLELPRVDGGTARADVPATMALSIDAEGRLFLADEPIETAALDLKLRDAARADARTEVHLRADRRVPYGRVAELIGQVQAAGLTRIGFVAEAPPATR